MSLVTRQRCSGKVPRIFAQKTGAKLAGNEQVCGRETYFIEKPTSKSAYPKNF